MLYLTIQSARYLSIAKIYGGNMSVGAFLDYIHIGNGEIPSTSSILAYRPKYKGNHKSKLGAVFINLMELFPCVKKGIVPACRRFTADEDGFYKGKTIAEAADFGDNVKIFDDSKNILMYGFAFEACKYLHGLKGCFPSNFQTVVACFLPRSCL